MTSRAQQQANAARKIAEEQNGPTSLRQFVGSSRDHQHGTVDRPSRSALQEGKDTPGDVDVRVNASSDDDGEYDLRSPSRNTSSGGTSSHRTSSRNQHEQQQQQKATSSVSFKNNSGRQRAATTAFVTQMADQHSDGRKNSSSPKITDLRAEKQEQQKQPPPREHGNYSTVPGGNTMRVVQTQQPQQAPRPSHPVQVPSQQQQQQPSVDTPQQHQQQHPSLSTNQSSPHQHSPPSGPAAASVHHPTAGLPGMNPTGNGNKNNCGVDTGRIELRPKSFQTSVRAAGRSNNGRGQQHSASAAGCDPHHRHNDHEQESSDDEHDNNYNYNNQHGGGGGYAGNYGYTHGTDQDHMRYQQQNRRDTRNWHPPNQTHQHHISADARRNDQQQQQQHEQQHRHSVQATAQLPRGFENGGNTCFAAAAFTMLLTSTAVGEALRESNVDRAAINARLLQQQSGNRSRFSDEEIAWTFVHAARNHIFGLPEGQPHESEHRVFSDIKALIRQLTPYLNSEGQQEDAQEFIIAVLAKLPSVVLQLSRDEMEKRRAEVEMQNAEEQKLLMGGDGGAGAGPAADDADQLDASEQQQQQQQRRRTRQEAVVSNMPPKTEDPEAPLHKVLQGHSQTVTTCGNCNAVSTQADVWTVLPLPVDAEVDAELSVRDLIREMWKGTEVEDFKCEKCREQGKCRQTNFIISMPDVLLVQIKRFNWVKIPVKPKPKPHPFFDTDNKINFMNNNNDNNNNSSSSGYYYNNSNNRPSSGPSHWERNVARDVVNVDDDSAKERKDEQSNKSNPIVLDGDSSSSPNGQQPLEKDQQQQKQPTPVDGVDTPVSTSTQPVPEQKEEEKKSRDDLQGASDAGTTNPPLAPRNSAGGLAPEPPRPAAAAAAAVEVTATSCAGDGASPVNTDCAKQDEKKPNEENQKQQQQEPAQPEQQQKQQQQNSPVRSPPPPPAAAPPLPPPSTSGKTVAPPVGKAPSLPVKVPPAPPKQEFTYQAKKSKNRVMPCDADGTIKLTEFLPHTQREIAKANKQPYRFRCVYRLAGAVLHTGQMANSGHYVALARFPMEPPLDDHTDAQWAHLNDEKVSLHPHTMVMNTSIFLTGSYVLRYELLRREPIPWGDENDAVPPTKGAAAAAAAAKS